jgi:hypothetical protein
VDSDLLLVLGVLAVVLSFVSAVNSFSESRPPRMAIIFFVVGAGMMAYAMSHMQGGASLSQIPQAFVRVIGKFGH